MAAISFLMRGVIDKKSSITLRFKDNSKNIDIKIAIPFLKCYPQQFKNGKCKPNNLKSNVSDEKPINLQLEEIKYRLLSIYDKENNKISDIKKWLRENLIPDDTEINNNDFNSVLDRFLNEKKKNVKNNTYKKIKSRVNFLKEFVNQHFKSKGKVIELIDLDKSFLNTYTNHLDNLNYQTSTYNGKLIILRQIIKYASENDINVKNINITNKKNTQIKHPFVYLNFEELENIKKLKYKKDSFLDNARDWLLISCFTGQRISDTLSFNDNKIIEIDNTKFLKFTQDKTNKKMMIPILKEVQLILNKRKGKFPRKISDVKYNVYIKEVAKDANIDELVFGGKTKQGSKNRKIFKEYPKYMLVTSHIGRRSFATNFYSKIPNHDIMKFTGHTTERQFLDYIQKTEQEIGLELSNIFNNINY